MTQQFALPEQHASVLLWAGLKAQRSKNATHSEVLGVYSHAYPSAISAFHAADDAPQAACTLQICPVTLSLSSSGLPTWSPLTDRALARWALGEGRGQAGKTQVEKKAAGMPIHGTKGRGWKIMPETSTPA